MPIPALLAAGVSLLPNIGQFLTGRKQMQRAKDLKPSDVSYKSPELREMASMTRQGAMSNRMLDQGVLEGSAMRAAAGANYAAQQSTTDPSKIMASIGGNQAFASDLLSHYTEQGRRMKMDRIKDYMGVADLQAQEGERNFERYVGTKAAYEGAGMVNKYNAVKDASANVAGFMADLDYDAIHQGPTSQWFSRVFGKNRARRQQRQAQSGGQGTNVDYVEPNMNVT
jgi:hypothetical protein